MGKHIYCCKVYTTHIEYYFRQLVTSDMTISFFTGSLLLAFGAHAATTHGVYGEAVRSPMGGRVGHMAYGVVSYEHGTLSIPYAGNDHVLLDFQRLLVYHSFYKLILQFGLTKDSLLKSPYELDPR